MGTLECKDCRSNCDRRSPAPRRNNLNMECCQNGQERRGGKERRIAKTDPRYDWRRDGKWCSKCLYTETTVVS